MGYVKLKDGNDSKRERTVIKTKLNNNISHKNKPNPSPSKPLPYPPSYLPPIPTHVVCPSPTAVV